MPSQTKIAHLAKVSQSVVSRVLNGRARDFGISEETIARVRTIAVALNYQPNPAANMLLGRQTKLVGVIVRSFEDQFLAVILKELNSRALRAGYTLLVVGLEHGEFNAGQIRLLQGYHPDAFVVVGSTDFRTWNNAFLDSKKLIIQIGTPVPDSRIVSCSMNEEEAARLLVEHVVGLGHRKFGIVGDSTAASRVRTGHLRNSLREHGLSAPIPFQYLSEKESTAAGFDAAHYFLADTDRPKWPTVIISTGDLIALSFIRCLGDGGVPVPSFLSVASYNDIEPASLARPSLTTIHQPVTALAAAGMEMITGARSRSSVALSPSLKIRESTAKPRHS